MTGNYKSGSDDGVSAVRGRREESERERRDKRGHGLVEGYNFR